MASFHIHVDRENQVSNVRRLQGAKKNEVPQKRSVLRTINSNSTNLGLSQRTFKQDGKKPINPKSTKPNFRIQEDKLEEDAQAVLRTIEEDKTLAEKKEIVTKNVSKQTFELTENITSLQQPIKDIACLTIKESADEKMSECSFAYDESPMSVDRSLACKSPQIAVVKRSDDSIYDLDEYRDDIFKYLLESEDRNRPKAFYMRRQPDVTYSMRTVLVDWLVEVAEEYNLHSETLHIAIYIIDRFLSLMSVVRGKLQLLGTAAMFIASKYEEIYPPDVGEFVFITDDTYTKKQVFRMEHLILKVLMFDISVPTVYSFIQIICISCDQNEKIKLFASFLCELTLLEGDPYLSHMPSLIASSALALARFSLDEEEPWPSNLSKFTGYSLDNLAPVIGHLNDTHAKSKSIPYQAIQEKYKSSKLHNVSEIIPKPFIVIPKASISLAV